MVDAHNMQQSHMASSSGGLPQHVSNPNRDYRLTDQERQERLRQSGIEAMERGAAAIAVGAAADRLAGRAQKNAEAEAAVTARAERQRVALEAIRLQELRTIFLRRISFWGL